MSDVSTKGRPTHGLQMQSTLTATGVVEVALAQVPVATPGPDEVLVRIEAAPINPSDLITMLATGDPAGARQADGKLTVPVSPPAAEARAGRVGQPLPVGLAGAGTVIAAGADTEQLVGTRVGFLALAAGSFAQYIVVKAAECAPLSTNVSVRQAADLFCNPLTALAIAEHVKLEGHSALVHTAAASNVGQMLVRICREDGIDLVNVVRRDEQAETLRALGATWVVNSSAPDFREQLREAIAATGAHIAFDAIGGGTMAGELLQAFEAVAAARMPAYSAYGSFENKQVFIYGRLDRAPLALEPEDYGLLWDVSNWYMPGILGRVGPERAAELQMRVIRDITTTFASHFSHEISLTEALDSEVLRGYARMASGQKYLINPTL